jgi:hypothetical protein
VPEGLMLRYQSVQAASILERWRLHLLGWMKVAAENKATVLVIKYEDLDRDHGSVTEKVLSFLGTGKRKAIARPDPIANTIYVPRTGVVPSEEREAIRKFVVENIGSLEPTRSLFPEIYEIAT